MPYLDTYYHKRDHSLMVVLHNPIHTQMYSHTTWQTNLHSNVGFRYCILNTQMLALGLYYKVLEIIGIIFNFAFHLDWSPSCPNVGQASTNRDLRLYPGDCFSCIVTNLHLFSHLKSRLLTPVD